MLTQPTHITKRVMALLLTLVYVFGLVKPVMPVVKDLMAHTFYKMEHMATIHFENGKYHLHAELQQEAQKDSQKQAATISSSDFLYAHLKTEMPDLQFFPEHFPNTYIPYVDACPEFFVQPPILPPRC